MYHQSCERVEYIMDEITDLGVYVTSKREALCTVANYLQNRLNVPALEILESALYIGIFPEDGGEVYAVHKRTKTKKDVLVYVTFADWMIEQDNTDSDFAKNRSYS